MIKKSVRGATITQGDDAALSAQRAATSASSIRRFRFPFSPSQNCGYVLTNRYSRLFAISIEDLLVGIRIKLQYTPEKRRYSNFDLLVALSRPNCPFSFEPKPYTVPELSTAIECFDPAAISTILVEIPGTTRGKHSSLLLIDGKCC